MTDFGLSVQTGGVGIGNMMTEACGTLIYMGMTPVSPTQTTTGIKGWVWMTGLAACLSISPIHTALPVRESCATIHIFACVKVLDAKRGDSFALALMLLWCASGGSIRAEAEASWRLCDWKSQRCRSGCDGVHSLTAKQIHHLCLCLVRTIESKYFYFRYHVLENCYITS